MTSLTRLERLHRDYGPGRSEEKVALVRALGLEPLASPGEVVRLHEILLYLRAFPDDPALLAAAGRALARFSRRADVRRFRESLAGTGIAGTPIRYRFFWPMARWLASRWPERLRYAAEGREFEPRLRAALPILASPLEAEAIKRSERVVLPEATWVLARLAALRAAEEVRESIHDTIDATYELAPGPNGPSRTDARVPAPIVFRTSPPRRDRPDLARALRLRPRSVRRVGPAEGARLIDLARGAMVTRARDLDAFAWGNPRDVRIVEDGDGLAFALIGIVPERRLPLPAVHGWLTLRNGVPTGYVQSDTLLHSSEIAFNTFETFRGTDASHVFARVLAVARHVLGARSFSIEPYQLGRGNDEGLASGAWWFYAHLGFRPKDAKVLRLYRDERRQMRRRTAHRSSRAVLERLGASHLFWGETASAPALLPRVPHLGLRLPTAGADPEALAAEASLRLGVRSLRGWTASERWAFRALAPVLIALSKTADRRLLVAIARAKGARDEDRSIGAWRKVPQLRALLR